MGSVTKLSVCSFAATAALSIVPAAFAGTSSPPPGTPSIGQYVETVPTAKGGSTAGVGTAKSKQLPPSIERRLRALPPAVARRLEAIATSSAYGAPQQGTSPNAVAPTAANPLSAAVTAVSGSSDTRVFWLLGAVIFVTTAMVWATARRHRA
jgi:hypothetical protein